MIKGTELELCWGVSPQAALPELIDAASANGFASITITPGHYKRIRSDGYCGRSIRDMLTRRNIKIGVLDPVGISMPGARTVDQVPDFYRPLLQVTEQECFRIAKVLEIPTINVANSQCNPLALGAVIDGIGGIAERAARYELNVLIEFQPGTNVPDLAAACTIVRALGPSKAKIMFDSWHFARTRGSISDLLDVPAGFIGGLQISDRIEPSPGEKYIPMSGRLLPGDGLQPLAEILTTIFRRHRDLRIGAEIFSQKLASVPVSEAARAVAAAFARLLEQITPESDHIPSDNAVRPSF